MPPTLKSLLQKSTATNIQSCLIKSLTEASPEQLKALEALLAPLSAESSISKHCMRCHKEYVENENHKEACKIEHHDEGECERTEVGSDAMTATLSCCGYSYDPEFSSPSAFCILDFHTTDEDAVVYYDQDDDDDDDGVNQNVVTCLKAGCLKKRKKVSKGAGDFPAKKRNLQQPPSAVQEPSGVDPKASADALANANDMVKFLRKPDPRKPRLATRQAQFEALFKPIDLPELPEALQYKGGYPIPPELFYGFVVPAEDYGYQMEVITACFEFHPFDVEIEPVFGCEENTIAAFRSNRGGGWQNAPPSLIDFAAGLIGQKPMWYLSLMNCHWSFP